MNETKSQVEEIFGVWRLVSLDALNPNGEATTGWLGTKPTGILVYDRSGYMSVQIMRGPRTDSAQDKFASHFGYYAYFGTLEMNEKSQTIIHHVQGSLRPDEVGRDYEQNFTLAGDRLELLTPTHLVQGEERRNRIIFERV
jgi:hypothetical protein